MKKGKIMEKQLEISNENGSFSESVSKSSEKLEELRSIRNHLLNCISVEYVTPELAKEYLEKNIQNRPLRKSKVKDYLAQMEDGEWMTNTGETLKFDEDGNLIDGQHRLHAVIQYDKPVAFIVVREIPREARHKIDTGANRTASDMIAMNGGKYTHLTSSIIKRMFKYKNEFKSIRIYPKKVLDYYKKDREELEFVAEESEKYYSGSNKLIRQSDIGFMYYLTRKIDAEYAKEFIEKVSLGINIDNMDSPEFRLRSFLIDDKKSDEKVSSRLRLKTWIKFWNKSRNGETIKKFHTANKFEKAI